MLWWLAQNALVTAALAVVVAGICRVGRFSPAVRHALWLVVLIKLITPPLVWWPWSPTDLWPIAEAEISLFVYSTWSTDFILVADDDLDRAKSALVGAGHIVQ